MDQEKFITDFSWLYPYNMRDHMKHLNPNEIGTPYWICDFCARARGGVYFKTASTASEGVPCEYCEDVFRVEKGIFPALDYIWPSQAIRDPERYKEWAKDLAERWASYKVPLVSHSDAVGDPHKTISGIADWHKFRDEELDRILKGWGIA